MAGEHKSPYRGFAVEFAQHREYTHGDDTRHLDWKVLGRTDRYYIKQYEQETNFVAHILLDASESMTFGDPRKFDFARQIAAAIGYVALCGFDRVSVIPFPNAECGMRNADSATSANAEPRTANNSELGTRNSACWNGTAPEPTAWT